MKSRNVKKNNGKCNFTHRYLIIAENKFYLCKLTYYQNGISTWYSPASCWDRKTGLGCAFQFDDARSLSLSHSTLKRKRKRAYDWHSAVTWLFAAVNKTYCNARIRNNSCVNLIINMCLLILSEKKRLTIFGH